MSETKTDSALVGLAHNVLLSAAKWDTLSQDDESFEAYFKSIGQFWSELKSLQDLDQLAELDGKLDQILNALIICFRQKPQLEGKPVIEEGEFNDFLQRLNTWASEKSQNGNFKNMLKAFITE